MLKAHTHGFTLVELLVATAAMAFVIFFALGSLTVQHRTYMVVDQVSETQQSSHAVARLLERDIRNAGYLVPAAAASCGVDNTDAADTLLLSDTDAILPADLLAVELASTELGAETSNDPSSTGSMVVFVDDVVLDDDPTYDVDSDGTLDSDFQIGGGAVLVDTANPDRGVACGLVTAVATTSPMSVTVSFDTVMSTSVASPSVLALVPAHAYVVNPGPPSQLQRDGTMLVKDVEDLQIVWFYDDDRDGQIDDPGETRGVTGTPYDTSLIDGNDLREIRFNLIMRTRSDDPRNPTGAGTGQFRENRTTGVAGDDGKRRRIHTATLRVRNLTL